MNININDSRKVNLDFQNLLVLYKHYKDFLLPVGVIIASILVIIYVIFPQIQQYFNSQDSLKTEQQKLQTLKNNYNFLASLDDSKTAADLDSLSQALPPQKDFAGIIDAISLVSAKTGVAVGNFQFALGNLSASNLGGTAYPSIKIDINLTGSSKAISAFAREIVKTKPVSEVTAVNITSGAGSITVLFYYKPFPSQSVSDQTVITPLSTKDTSTLNEISSWNSAGQEQLPLPAIPPVSLPSSPPASSSGSPF